MLTRGRAANHLYLQVVGDGDPHTIIRPETVAPRTPIEILQQILARDDTPTSATTLLREQSDPAARLFEAVQRYTDGLHVAAEQLVGPQIVQMLDGQADQVIPELTNEPSWPALRAHLLALAAETGEHPIIHLHTAAAGRELHTAGDMAAVLDWRLPDPAASDPAPLPWLPGVPEALHDHPVWGQYLATRAELIADLAAHVRGDANGNSTPPVWATGSRPSAALVGEVEVWRAANGIDPTDHRATGAGQLPTASALWQDHLDRSVADCSDDLNRLHVRAHEARVNRSPARRSTARAPATRDPPELAAQRRVIGAPRRQVEGSERTGYPVGRLRAAQPTAEYSSIRSRAGAPRRPRRVSSLRCGPRRLGLQRGRL